MKNKSRFLLYGAFAVALAAVGMAGSQVSVFGSIVDALTGFTVGHAAPTGQVICGNGTVGTYSASCPIAAQTAVTLAATPTQCAGAATGIQANGNANCGSLQGSVTTPGKTLGVTYTNATGGAIFVIGDANTPTGGSTGTIRCQVGPTSTMGIYEWQHSATATVNTGEVGFVMFVPATWSYRCDGDGAVGGVHDWTESALR